MKIKFTVIVMLLQISVPLLAVSDSNDPYLLRVYDRLHWSPMQEKFRAIAPLPVGAVYIQRPGEDQQDMRRHFRMMRTLGFTALKGIMAVPEWDRADIAMIALEEGIIPWWYGQAGWQTITPALLKKLGIPADMPMFEVRRDERMLAYQRDFLKSRIERLKQYRQEHGERLPQSTVAFVKEVGGVGPDLSEHAKPLFLKWVKNRYQTIDALNFAYNQHHSGLQPVGSTPFVSWEDFARRWEQQNFREYRHLSDIFRFKAEARLEYSRKRIAQARAFDPELPFRGGGEMAMFLPTAYWGVDMARIAELMTDCGAFYPSIHLSWHFHEVDHEIVRPVYMQASAATDIFKGGWAASWESTGGPQQFDGGKGGEGFTVDEKTMAQLMFSYLAAGFKGFGFWCWSARTAGKEAGEYSLLDRHNKVTPRAIRVGRIGQAARRYRDELWRAHKEPLVGVYMDWENEAVWAAMSVRGRDIFRQWPISARIGVSRALINANIPFEYVTADDLEKGLADRYRIIYMPFILAMKQETMVTLSRYVRDGGRLVMDMPSAWYDQNTSLMSTDRDTVFEQTFGVTIDAYQYAGTNRPYRLDKLPLKGFVVDLTPTFGNVLATYDNGKPAIVQSQYGSGTAVLLGYEASMLCFPPENRLAESMLIEYTMGGYASPYACDNAIVYRLAAPRADHYFLINDGPRTNVKLDTKQYAYVKAINAVTQEQVQLNKPLQLNSYDGLWLRCQKP